MNPKLIFLDIDGTLTMPGSNEPPQSALEAIRAAQRKGNLVFLCSGRNPGMLEPLLKYGFDGVISCAGGYVTVGDELIYDMPMTREEMELVCQIAKEHDLFVIGDEVYREFVYENDPLQSILQLEGLEENAIVIDSVSKRFSACGARIGCLLSRNKELIQNVMKYAQGRLSTPTIDQIGSAALYNVGPEYFDAVRKEYKARRDTMVEGLSKIPGVIYSNPKGAFYCMAKLRVDNAESFQTWLLKEYNNNGETVMFAPAAGFYATPGSGVNEIRMAYVLKREDIARAMELLADAIEKYNNR